MQARLLIGWSEWASLPDFGIPRLRAKIDTGARSCALHVLSVRTLTPDDHGRTFLELKVPFRTRPQAPKTVTVRVLLLDNISVRDSGGHAERRPVIETTLRLGPVERLVRITLTHRGDMRFPMLIGRTGLDRRFLIDPESRYLLGKPE